MKKRITIAFILIFSLFLAGSTVMIYNLVRTTGNLRYLIGLHEIEDIRQDLFSSIQKVSAYVYGTSMVFTSHLDEVIDNTNKMHNAIRRCSECHHDPGVEAELIETTQMVDLFEEQLSYLITIVADVERRHNKQEEVLQASTDILNRVQEMVIRAGRSIDRKTVQAMDELNRMYILIGITLLATIITAVLIAHYLVRSITRPIDALVDSARRIADGKWGYQTDFKGADEFQELINSFNTMSRSLAHKKELEQRHLEELRSTQQQLIEAEKLTALGTMAGGIAHDFNNILCGMIGHLNVLARQIPPDDEHRKTIDTIEQAGFRAAELVKQLLTFARQKPLQIAPVDLNKCINGVRRLIKDSFDDNVTINFEPGKNLPLVYGDAGQLEQVFINLCLNARDAMPDGGTIAITTSAADLDDTFRARHHDAETGPYVVVTVRDTGTGINEKILPRVFDPFFTTREVGKGTGLGLAMVYGIVKNHDGFCLIESSPGRGTTFTIYLPAGEGKEAGITDPAPETSLKGRTILIVDDEEIVTSMLQDWLEDLGCKTLTARNGKEAVEIYRDGTDTIDLVILDIIMPVMNGRETCRELMKLNPRVRVLVSSGYIMNAETQEILNMGARGFLQKPFNMETITAKLKEILAADASAENTG